MRTTLSIAASAFAALCLAAVPAFAADSDALFPFVVEKGAPANITNVRTWDDPSPAADSDGIFTPKDGKFTADSGPRRLMGTNLCFSGSFPTKEKAERLAATLGRFGIGVVRLHHMDSRDIWGKNAKNSLLEIDPEQLDKLDYLISQFRKHGIYVNINLHVSRKFDERDGFVNSAKLPEHTKGVDNFERRMIEYQKKYAKDLLAHVNPYTKYAYVDDPGVAVIEINNENSVVASWSWGQLDSLPEPYCDEFRAIWNGWLTKKYGSTKKLRAAWGCKDVPLGDNVVAMGDFPADFNFNGPWRIESDAQTKFSWKILGKAETGIDANALRLDVESLGSEFWRPQFHFTGLKIKGGAPYVAKFKIRSANSATVNFSVREDHDPWGDAGGSKNFAASPEWQDCELAFIGAKNDDAVRISFNGFHPGDSFELADVSLREGGVVGLAPTAKLEDGSVPILERNGSGSSLFGKKAAEDFSDFLHDIENDYWQEMYNYVKNDLGAKQPVAGTQLQYGFWHNQARLDYCDIHAYWNHPNFPNRQWDMNDWYVKNTCLANSPVGGTVSNLAALRVLGLPFTCSEYDHPYPNQYCAEGNLALAAVAAFQDWAATFQFAWSHSDNYEPEATTSFFDMCSQTVKIAHLPACYGIFVRGDVKSGPGEFVYAPSMTEAEEMAIMRSSLTGYHRSLEGLGLDKSLSLAVYSGVNLPDLAALPGDVAKAKKIDGWKDLPERFGGKEKKEIVNEFGQIVWNWQKPGKGWFKVDSPNSKVFSGFVGDKVEFDGATLAIGETELGWATVSLVKANNVDKDQTTGALTEGKYLLTATGTTRNTDAVFKDLGEDNITAAGAYSGSNGSAPILCEGVPATIELKGVNPAKVGVYALDARGDRSERLSVREVEGGAAFDIGAEYKTIWYEIVVAGD